MFPFLLLEGYPHSMSEPVEIQWTTTPPQGQGPYWWRKDAESQPVKRDVFESKYYDDLVVDGLEDWNGSRLQEEVSSVEGMWSGPL